MTRFALDFKGPAEGALASPGIAQSKVIVGLEPEITALIDKAKTFNLALVGEPRRRRDGIVTIKMRYCWMCGKEMGMIDSRYYDRGDTCGEMECAREERDADRAEREEAHRDFNERMGW